MFMPPLCAPDVDHFPWVPWGEEDSLTAGHLCSVLLKFCSWPSRKYLAVCMSHMLQISQGTFFVVVAGGKMMGQLVRAVVRGLGSKLRVSLASYSVVSIAVATKCI